MTNKNLKNPKSKREFKDKVIYLLDRIVDPIIVVVLLIMLIKSIVYFVLFLNGFVGR